MLQVSAIAATLFLLIIFAEHVQNQMRIFVFSKTIPFDLVFDEGINYSDYDGAQVLNCLHSDGKFCPEGIRYKDDVTGQIIVTNVTIPKKTVAVVGAPDPTPDMFINDTPQIQTMLENGDNIAKIMYGVLIAGVAIILVYVLIKKKIKYQNGHLPQ